MLVRWNLTVCSATQSSLPIASLERPRATADRMAVSRSVSPAALAGFSPDSRQNLRAGRGFSDHLEVARLLERPFDPVDDQLVVVGDENSHARMVVGDPDGGHGAAV